MRPRSRSPDYASFGRRSRSPTRRGRRSGKRSMSPGFRRRGRTTDISDDSSQNRSSSSTGYKSRKERNLDRALHNHQIPDFGDEFSHQIAIPRPQSMSSKYESINPSIRPVRGSRHQNMGRYRNAKDIYSSDPSQLQPSSPERPARMKRHPKVKSLPMENVNVYKKLNASRVYAILLHLLLFSQCVFILFVLINKFILSSFSLRYPKYKPNIRMIFNNRTRSHPFKMFVQQEILPTDIKNMSRTMVNLRRQNSPPLSDRLLYSDEVDLMPPKPIELSDIMDDMLDECEDAELCAERPKEKSSPKTGGASESLSSNEGGADSKEEISVEDSEKVKKEQDNFILVKARHRLDRFISMLKTVINRGKTKFKIYLR